MKKEKKEALEKKLHHNIVDMIDEFSTDHNVNITEITYKASGLKRSEDSDASYNDIIFEIVTDLT